MGRMLSLVGYKAHSYIRANRYFIPLVALLLFQSLHYAVQPVRAADSYGFSAVILFLVMVWTGFAYGEVEDPVSEQLLILKSGSAPLHYASSHLLLLGFSILLGMACVAYPLLADLVLPGELYKARPTLGDALQAILLHSATGFLGASVGVFFHPRILRDRKIGLLCLFFICTVGFVKPGIHRVLPFARAVTWLFPPASEVASAFAGEDHLAFSRTAKAVLLCAAHGLVWSAAQVVILLRRKF